jgi:hypothetical protein
MEWSAASTATDNGGTVIRPDSAPVAGRWLSTTPDFIMCGKFGAGNSQSAAVNAAAIQAAIDWAASRGGGEVLVEPSANYDYSTGLTVPKNVRLRGLSLPGSNDGQTAAILAPTNAVSAGISVGSAASAQGTGIDGITLDMNAMPSGATGILSDGAWLCGLRNIRIHGLPDATAIGIHARGNAVTGSGNLYSLWENVVVANHSAETVRGVGIKLESVGADKVNALSIINARVARLTTGWIFEGTGSGITCINCNSESQSGDAIQVNNTTAGTAVKWIGGEIGNNGGWGVTGSAGIIEFDNTAFGTNTAGNFDTANVTAVRLRATNDPAFVVDNGHIRTSKSFIGGADNQTVIAGDTITAGALKVRLTAAGAITMTSDPQIENGTSNQILILVGTSNTNTVEIVDGQGCRLAGNCTLGVSDTLTLMYDSGGSNDWTEIARSNN